MAQRRSEKPGVFVLLDHGISSFVRTCCSVAGTPQSARRLR
nr:hypothetical protein [Kibdelosporangium sp. MJ126-NF4]